MNTTIPAVKTTEHSTAADAPVVETPEDTSATVSVESDSNADLLPALEAALATIDKVSSERDNYRKVALAKKRGETVDPTDPAEIDRIAEDRANEIIKDRETEHAVKTAREALAAKIKVEKENRELRLALKNKNGVVTAPATTSRPDATTTPNNSGTFFSESQLNALKQMQKHMPAGVVLDPKKIEELHRRRAGR